MIIAAITGIKKLSSTFNRIPSASIVMLLANAAGPMATKGNAAANAKIIPAIVPSMDFRYLNFFLDNNLPAMCETPSPTARIIIDANAISFGKK